MSRAATGAQCALVADPEGCQHAAMIRHRLCALALLALTSCSTLQFDLDGVPFPISASPVSGARGAERFELRGKHILWVHGLLGDSQPDVKQMLVDNCIPCAAVADFRITSGANFFDWLGTHLSLGFVRLKTVTITGTRLPVAR